MPSFPRPTAGAASCCRVGILVLALALPLSLAAQARRNPASKIYVSDVSGQAQIDTGEKIHALSRRSVYNAEGTVIETKPVDAEGVRRKNYSTMVYSNGTGAYFDADTRVEVRRFVQEPFTPTRTDVDVEPSISVTQAFVARGTVGLCTSRLVAGSSMTYQTPHAAINVRGRRVVIEAGAETTRISMLDGESTVRAGAEDAASYTVRAGEQAVIRRGPAGQPSQIQIRPIPPAEAPALDEKVTLACMAKRTVYFEVREQPSGSEPVAETAPAPGTPGVVTAFYDNSASTTAATREIVAVPVVPASLPVPFVVSPANLTSPQ